MRGEPLPAADPPPIGGPVLVAQRWREVVLVHWAVDPGAVTPLLPAGTWPDTLDGQAHVGIVAFGIPGTYAFGRAPVGSAYEVNVRVYCVDEEGRHSTVFLRMDVSRPDMVLLARMLASLPYTWSKISFLNAGGTDSGSRSDFGYRCRPRLARGAPFADLVVEPGPAIEAPTALEQFVTARWYLHQGHPLGTYRLPVAHRRWPLHRARPVKIDDSPVRRTGLTPLDPSPLSVLWSPGVDAEFGPPRFCKAP
ncbi:YqjF family protein [Actinopolymorpha singaporensis]